MSKEATNSLISQTFPEGSLLCAIWAAKDGEFINGALCLTRSHVSFLKASFWGKEVSHYPLPTTIVKMESGIFMNTISLVANGTEQKFIAEKKSEAVRFVSSQQLQIR